MEKSISKATHKFLDKNPFLKESLVKGFVNYTALAKHIVKQELSRDVNHGAVIIALQRYKQKNKHDKKQESNKKEVLKGSEIEVKTKIGTIVVKKQGTDDILDVQKKIKDKGGYIQAIEGDNTYTIITNEKHVKEIANHYSSKVVDKKTDLALFLLKSSDEIETTPGIISYLYSLLSVNNINVIESMSCWTDTLFLIDSKDFNKAVELLEF